MKHQTNEASNDKVLENSQANSLVDFQEIPWFAPPRVSWPSTRNSPLDWLPGSVLGFCIGMGKVNILKTRSMGYSSFDLFGFIFLDFRMRVFRRIVTKVLRYHVYFIWVYSRKPNICVTGIKEYSSTAVHSFRQLYRSVIVSGFMSTYSHFGGKVDVQALIKKFNGQNTQAFQLTGAKAQAVRALLEDFPPQALKCVQDHVQSVGWQNCGFTDDALSSKKFLPGHVFRNVSGSKTWNAWGKVTVESANLSMNMQWGSSPAPAQKQDASSPGQTWRCLLSKQPLWSRLQPLQSRKCLWIGWWENKLWGWRFRCTCHRKMHPEPQIVTAHATLRTNRPWLNGKSSSLTNQCYFGSSLGIILVGNSYHLDCPTIAPNKKNINVGCTIVKRMQ